MALFGLYYPFKILNQLIYLALYRFSTFESNTTCDWLNPIPKQTLVFISLLKILWEKEKLLVTSIFLLFPQFFPKASLSRSLKRGIVW